MRHIPTDKYSIAWFKLAECIARGEREKAYGVYRLLAHSLADQAYAFQLEGDLLRCFDDQRAIEKYHLAARIYYQEKRWLEAAGIGEHLKNLNELSAPLHELLVEVHLRLGNKKYAAQLLQELALLYMSHHQYELVLARLEQILSQQINFMAHAKAILFKGIESSVPAECISGWLQQIIQACTASHDSQLQLFMSELAVLSPEYYAMAQELLQD